jgi:hypothetical protein
VIDPDSKICFGISWVCENLPQRAWTEVRGCQCGAGMPCGCVHADGLEEPDVRQVLDLQHEISVTPSSQNTGLSSR